MSLIPASKRDGLLVAVITGGRPQLKQRPTAKFFTELKEAGFNNIVWVVAERDAAGYEQDEHEMVVYPDKWAEEYAATHWMTPKPYEPGTFYGAFVGREAACLEAEKRGCWGVLQLDDNIIKLEFGKGGAAGHSIMKQYGGMGLVAEVLSAITLSTNGRMVGAQLASIPQVQTKVSRPGFPYSCFIEQVGEGREHWYGPFEDDITHALQYGTRAEQGTPLVASALLYSKESKSKTGMRSRYNHERAVNLHRIFPEAAKVVAKATKSNGLRTEGSARVFHQMNPRAIKTPQVITDKDLYLRTRNLLGEMMKATAEARRNRSIEKVEERVAKSKAKQQQASPQPANTPAPTPIEKEATEAN